MEPPMKNVLLVEDDDCLRESLKLILGEADLAVETAPDGKSALHVLQQHAFDAIILDDNLPFIQGSELLGLIRIQNPKVKIIVMSGLFNADGIKKIKALGADMVLEKPFNFELITDYLQQN